MKDLFYKSILGGVFIALGVMANLSLGYPIGPFLFAFGLMAVCLCDAYLYTGGVGFWWRKRPWEGVGRSYRLNTIAVFIINCIAGFGAGILLGVNNPHVVTEAVARVLCWELSLPFFIKSVFCGIIMYLCVYIWKRHRTLYGIFLGVPLFIFSGFQHSIANAVMLGVALENLAGVTWNHILCIMLAGVGNAAGAILCDEFMENQNAKEFR